jgi:hypothetical protein
MARELTEYNGVLCWCDIDHVTSLTGQTVDDNAMSQAQGIISVVTDVWPDELPEDLRPADRRRLADALAYQAPWVAGRVDLFAEVQAQGVSQDGLSATYVSDYSQFLAPIAQVCLNRLSWNRAGITTKRPGRRPYADADAAAAAVLRDEACDTSGMGGFVPGRPFS